MGKSQVLFSLFFILAMTNLQRIFSLSVNLIIPITYQRNAEKSRKTFNYFIALYCRRGRLTHTIK